jgi:hypothetical protein
MCLGATLINIFINKVHLEIKRQSILEVLIIIVPISGNSQYKDIPFRKQ